MCRRTRHSTRPPHPAPGSDQLAVPTAHPDTLAEAAPPAPDPRDPDAHLLAEYHARKARRERRDALARAARAQGRRLATVCGRFRGRGRVPDLRLSGRWLAAAGFDLGQMYEVTIESGRLTIRAV